MYFGKWFFLCVLKTWNVFQLFSRLLPNTGKWVNFLEIFFFRKWVVFEIAFYIETNRALDFRFCLVGRMEKWEGRKCWEDRKVEDETFGWTMKSEKIENVVYMHLCPYYKKKEKKKSYRRAKGKKVFWLQYPTPPFFL